tara:strand:+ start:1509 stop:1760 length:252 start_codon:yes stop_codon:yes gene_type:complete
MDNISSSGKASTGLSARDTIRETFSKGLISDCHAWTQMLTDRNRTYNEETAEAILSNIRLQNHPLLKELEQTMHSRAKPTPSC